MTENEKKKILNDMNTEDFNTMRSMLSEIEMKIMQLDPMHQREFYLPIKNMIFEAWDSAIDPENEWLYKDGRRIKLTDDYLTINGFEAVGVDLWHHPQGFRIKQGTSKTGKRFFTCLNSNKIVKYADEITLNH